MKYFKAAKTDIRLFNKKISKTEIQTKISIPFGNRLCIERVTGFVYWKLNKALTGIQ